MLATIVDLEGLTEKDSWVLFPGEHLIVFYGWSWTTFSFYLVFWITFVFFSQWPSPCSFSAGRLLLGASLGLPELGWVGFSLSCCLWMFFYSCLLCHICIASTMMCCVWFNSSTCRWQWAETVRCSISAVEVLLFWVRYAKTHAPWWTLISSKSHILLSWVGKVNIIKKTLSGLGTNTDCEGLLQKWMGNHSRG